MTNPRAIDTPARETERATIDETVMGYRTASEANDLEAMLATLAPGAELVSPISGRVVIRGHADLGLLLSAVYHSMSGLRWTSEIGEGLVRVLIGEARVGPLRITDAMVLDIAPDGKIQRIRPHLRPWLAITLFALIVGPKVARHPGVLWRALRSR